MNGLSESVANAALRSWSVTRNNNQIWEVKNSRGEPVRTYPEHWLETSIWAVLKDMYFYVLTDANIALQLSVDDFKLELKQSANSSGGVWFAQYYNDDFINAFTGYDQQPATAICKAYLALTTHEKERQ